MTYGYKSASKTAGASIPAGATAFTVTATDKAANPTTGTYSVAVDATGPTVSGVAIANTTTSAAGWLRKSGAYIVYANATDPSGISTVKANVSTITSGQTALALSACTTACTVGGVTYGYKSASKTAASTLAAGAVSFTVTATDGVGNATTANGAATADNTAPTASAEAIAPTATGVPGYIGQGRPYMVYTNAADVGSGVYSVTASVKNVTTGQTALALPACVSGCTIGGVVRGYASAALTANASLTGTSKTYTVTVTDLAGNAATSANQTVTVDNTAPTVAITFPTSSYSGGWLAGCSTPSTADICGTATDATSGVAGVQVSLRQAAAPSLYWNPATSSFSSATEVLDARDARAAELVARGRIVVVHEPELLHDPRRRHRRRLEHRHDVHDLHLSAVARCDSCSPPQSSSPQPPASPPTSPRPVRGPDRGRMELIASVKHAVSVTSTPVTGLYPGASKRLTLRIKNTYTYPVKITSVKTKLAVATNRPGCAGARTNLLVSRPGGAVNVKPKKTRSVIMTVVMPSHRRRRLPGRDVQDHLHGPRRARLSPGLSERRAPSSGPRARPAR